MNLDHIDFRGDTRDIEPPQIGTGSYFRIRGRTYVLARTKINEVNLFDIGNGARWGSPIDVEDAAYLSKQEFRDLILPNNLPSTELVQVEITVKD